MYSTDSVVDSGEEPYGEHVFGISIQEGQRCVLQLLWEEDKYVSVTGYYGAEHQKVER